MVSFAVQKLVSLVRYHCLLLLLFLLPWETDLGNHWYIRMFCLCSLLVLWCCLVFKSLRHFEFNFVYGVRVPSNFTNLHVAVHLRESVLDWFAGVWEGND